MMIIIGDKKLEKKGTLEEDLALIKEYLYSHEVILVNESGESLTEEQIKESLMASGTSTFFVKSIKELEEETLEDIVPFLNSIEQRIQEIVNDHDETITVQTIIQDFVDINSTLIELEKVDNYFSLGVIDGARLEGLSKKALDQVEQGNFDYIKDLLEYEYQPLLSQLSYALERRRDKK